MPSNNSHARVTSFHEVRLTDFRDNGSFYSPAMIMGNVNTILDYQNYEFILIVSSKEQFHCLINQRKPKLCFVVVFVKRMLMGML